MFRSEDLDFAVRLVQEALNSTEKDGKGVFIFMGLIFMFLYNFKGF